MSRESDLTHFVDDQSSSCFSTDRMAELTSEQQYYEVAPDSAPPGIPAGSMRGLGQNIRDLGRAAVAGPFAAAPRGANWTKPLVEAGRSLAPAKIGQAFSFVRAEVD